jgi:hypothetical protein
MVASKIESHETIDDSEKADDTNVDHSENKGAGRRLLDGLISKDPGRKFNVDRRTKGSDRRSNSDPGYNGPARRNTIDRRINLKDRREKR